MSAIPTWSLLIDDEDNYTFGQAVTVYGLWADTMIGMENYWNRIAPPCRMVLEVDDSGHEFSPEHANAGDIMRGRFVRLVADYNSITYPVFTGMVMEVAPLENSYRCRIEVRGRWAMANSPIEMPLMTNTTAGAVILEALQRAQFRGHLNLASGAGYWILDEVGHSELGSNTYLSDLVYNTSLATGQSVFEIVGDTWAGATVQQIVRDMTVSEWGWFYENQAGELVFADRHETLTETTLAATLDSDDLTGHGYTWGDEIINEVVITLQQRDVNEGATLWSSITPIRFKEGYREYTIRFLATDGRVLGVQGDIIPLSFVFLDNDGLTLTNVSYQVDNAGTGAVLRVNNPNHLAILQVGATLQGTALVKENPISYRITAPRSVSFYGRSYLSLPLPDFVDSDVAVDLANFIVSTTEEPSGRLRSFTMQNTDGAALAVQLGLDMLDLVRVTLPDIGHDSRYVVCGIRHEVRDGGMRLKTRVYLAPHSDTNFWLVEIPGYSELDQTTVTGY